jgi:hypothetical protein
MRIWTATPALHTYLRYDVAIVTGARFGGRP